MYEKIKSMLATVYIIYIYILYIYRQSYVPIASYEPWSILTIWLMAIPSIIRILIMVIINPYEPLDD